MMKKGASDDEFISKYESFENQTAEDFIRKHSRTEEELRETISYLIQHRELIRDVELQKLEEESRKLIERLHGISREKLIEEIKCFKDILALQRRLLENGTP